METIQTSVLVSFFTALFVMLLFVIYNRAKKASNVDIVKDFNWDEMLNRATHTLYDVVKMYLASITFGHCATGELFGSLDDLKKRVNSEVYQKLESLHNIFGMHVSIMYAYRRDREGEYYQAAKLDALATFRRMEEVKRELQIPFVDPFVVNPPLSIA